VRPTAKKRDDLENGSHYCEVFGDIKSSMTGIVEFKGPAASPGRMKYRCRRITQEDVFAIEV
jgi:hypothetical protein